MAMLNSNQSENTRIEWDSIGAKTISQEAYYGLQSLRAVENFAISHLKLIPEFINSLAIVKKACACANKQAGVLKPQIADAIMQSCDQILNGLYHDQFVVDPIQGGAGTSMNMNANEVIANIAIEILGGQKGDYSIVHPNDQVNCGQSTNDVIPTAGKITTLFLIRNLTNNLQELQESLTQKSWEFDNVVKMGRTQLQDAVPIRLGQEFHAYASCVQRGMARIIRTREELLSLNIGGTAIGTGLNADRSYFERITQILSDYVGENFHRAPDLIDSTQNIDCFAAVSSSIRNCAIALSKIANDLRLMSSGPRTGWGEITLPPRQNGSSIMPGKVNPVIPEVVNQVAFLVAGNDVTISLAVESGQMELNAFEPIIFHSLFQSIEMLSRAVSTFTHNCIEDIRANTNRCQELLDASVGTVTALSPYLGYTNAAAIAKEALAKNISVRQLVLAHGLLSEERLNAIMNAYEMTSPGIAGKN